MNGIEFTYKTGEKESYDPINIPDDFLELPENITFTLSNGESYIVEKKIIESFRIYECCDLCGHELYEDEFKCHNWGCRNNLDTDNQEVLNSRNCALF
jgi:hypothetical protein